MMWREKEKALTYVQYSTFFAVTLRRPTLTHFRAATHLTGSFREREKERESHRTATWSARKRCRSWCRTSRRGSGRRRCRPPCCRRPGRPCRRTFLRRTCRTWAGTSLLIPQSGVQWAVGGGNDNFYLRELMAKTDMGGKATKVSARGQEFFFSTRSYYGLDGKIQILRVTTVETRNYFLPIMFVDIKKVRGEIHYNVKKCNNLKNT